MDAKAAVKNLKEIKDIFDKAGITFWIDSGTLLGAVRNGKFIEWDEDIDLGTWYDNIAKIISVFSLFTEGGFQVGLNKRLGQASVKKDVNIGVSLYRRTSDYAWVLLPAKNQKIEKLLRWFMYRLIRLETYTETEEKRFYTKGELLLAPLPSKLRHFMGNMTWSTMNKCDCIIYWVIPKCYFEKLSTIQFYGMEFNIPSNVERYLGYRYGSTWKTSNKKWKWFKDDGAINPNFKEKIPRLLL